MPIKKGFEGIEESNTKTSRGSDDGAIVAIIEPLITELKRAFNEGFEKKPSLRAGGGGQGKAQSLSIGTAEKPTEPV